MKMVRPLILVTAFMGVLSPGLLQAQAAGRVFNPEINPLNNSLISFERQEGDRRELYFQVASGRATPLATADEVGGALTFDLPGADDLSHFSGDLDWSPRSGGAGYPFAFVEATGSGLGLFLGSVTRAGDVPEASIQVDFDGNVRTPRWSPDGARLAFSSEGRIHLLQNARQVIGGSAPTIIEVAGSDGTALFPAWSPDGSMLAYQVQSGSSWNVEIVAIDNGRVGARVNLTSSDRAADSYRPSWSLDGRYVAYYSGRSGGGASALDIGVVQPQRNPDTNAVFRGEVLAGRATRIATDVLPNDVRGPTWTWVEDPNRGQRPGLVYVDADNSQDNPISVASIDRWLSRDTEWALTLSERANWGTVNNRYVTQWAITGRIFYAFAAQEGNAENLEIRSVLAPWLIIDTTGPTTAVGFMPAALFPGTGQFQGGQSGKGLVYMVAGLAGAAGAGYFATKPINRWKKWEKGDPRVDPDKCKAGKNDTPRPLCQKRSQGEIDTRLNSRKTGLFASAGLFVAAWAISLIDAVGGGGGGSSSSIQSGPMSLSPISAPSLSDLQPSIGFEFSLTVGGR